jgi:predicted 3-demethylubiquinone-9 3-methyltransferase (glyoxalase superfamily)
MARSQSALKHTHANHWERTIMTSVTTFLWFDTEAEEAANYYISLFDDGNITEVRHSGTAGPRPAGMVLEVDFELAGQSFTALNGGSSYRFNEAVSILVRCDTAEEVDR